MAKESFQTKDQAVRWLRSQGLRLTITDGIPRGWFGQKGERGQITFDKTWYAETFPVYDKKIPAYKENAEGSVAQRQPPPQHESTMAKEKLSDDPKVTAFVANQVKYAKKAHVADVIRITKGHVKTHLEALKAAGNKDGLTAVKALQDSIVTDVKALEAPAA